MRFYTLLIDEKEYPAVSFDGGQRLYTLASLGLPFADMNEVIRNISAAQMESLSSLSASVEPVEPAQYRILAPIVRPLQDVICLGINYSAHAVESERFSAESFGGERPYTIYFSKRVNEAPGPGAMIPSYQGLVDSLDYEAELGVILGRDAKNVTAEAAEDYIFGYTIINDVSARNLQTRHKQWYLGKSLDGFTPMGPCIVTPDELGDAGQLDIRCSINGELRQNSNTRYMIQTAAGAISELCQGMTLQAGTIIATGTPAGVGMGFTPPKFLKSGDTITCEIQGIGVLENTIGE